MSKLCRASTFRRLPSGMTERSLQVTYRKGRPFAAYPHLTHETGEKSAKTVPSADGSRIILCVALSRGSAVQEAIERGP